MPDATTTQTIVRNPTASSRYYGYLGRHGKTIVSHGHYAFSGTINDQIVLGGPGRYTRRRKSFENDYATGKIVIVTGPNIILEDVTTHGVKVLKLTNGVLSTVDASYGAYADT